MTDLDYPGEGQEITAYNAADFDGAPFGEADIESAVARVYSDDWQTLVSGPSDMVYDSDRSLWKFVWDTTGVPGGAAYHAWLELTPTDGLPMVEKHDLWVAADPRAA